MAANRGARSGRGSPLAAGAWTFYFADGPSTPAAPALGDLRWAGPQVHPAERSAVGPAPSRRGCAVAAWILGGKAPPPAPPQRWKFLVP